MATPCINPAYVVLPVTCAQCGIKTGTRMMTKEHATCQQCDGSGVDKFGSFSAKCDYCNGTGYETQHVEGCLECTATSLSKRLTANYPQQVKR